MKKTLLTAHISHEFHHTRILEPMLISLNTGEKVALIGANGSGKTSILKILAGHIKPTTGHVTCAGSVYSV